MDYGMNGNPLTGAGLYERMFGTGSSGMTQPSMVKPNVVQPITNAPYAVNQPNNNPYVANNLIKDKSLLKEDDKLGYGSLALQGFNMLGNLYAANKNYRLQKSLQDYLKKRESMNDRNQQTFARNVGDGATSALDNIK